MGIKTGKITKALVVIILSAAATILTQGCRSSYFSSIDLKPPSAQELAELKKKQIFDEVEDAVKDYAYAFYDALIGADALPKKSETKKRMYRFTEKGLEEITLETPQMPEFTPEEILKGKFIGARSQLEEILKKYDLGPVEDLERGNTQKLEDFFKKYGYSFARLNMEGDNFSVNFSLRKILKEEDITINIYGKERTYKLITYGRALIELFYLYSFKKQQQDLEIGFYIGGAAIEHEDDSKNIAHYPESGVSTAKTYYEGMKRLGKEIEEVINNPNLLDKYKSEDDTNPGFYRTLGYVLHYQGVKKEYETSKTLEEFTEKFMKLHRQEVILEESMHLIDKEDIDLDDYNNFFRFHYVGHMEARALLIRMQYTKGNSKRILGDGLVWLYYLESTGRNPRTHAAAAKLVVEQFVGRIRLNREELKEENSKLDFTEFNKTYDDNAIIKQFIYLTDTQVKKLAKETFEEFYEKKTLKRWILSR